MRASRWAGGGLALALALALLACAPTAVPTTGSTAPTAAPTAAATTAAASPPKRLVVLGSDGRAVELRREEADGAAPIRPERAVQLAARGLTAPPSAPGQASLVLLSVPAADGGALALDRRRVWLVVFPDAQFSADACVCEGSPTRPSTVVAVDAVDGAVLASYGFSG